MKSILSASICTAALAFAIPAMAATETTKHMHHHHMSKMGPKTHAKKAGDPSTDELNAKSLAAARGSSTPASADATAPAASGTSMAPGAAAMAPGTAPMAPGATTPGAMTAPTSGTTSTTTPSNAPGGQ